MRRNPDGPSRAGVLRRTRWAAEAAAVDVCLAGARSLGPRARLALGRVVGTAFWAIDARHRRNAERCIALAFGDRLTAAQVRQLARNSMRHYARLMLETAAFDDHLAESVHVEGVEHLRHGLSQGRGLLGFSGHFGHWELLRLAAAHHGVPSVALVRPLSNPLLDERLERLRGVGGNELFAQQGGVASALRLLREGRFVSMLIDQRTSRSGIPVSFLGRRAFAADTLAVLALRTGVPIVPGFACLEADGSWHVVFGPEVPVVRTGRFRDDVPRIMADCTAILERWVRRYPEQWLWTHARMEP